MDKVRAFHALGRRLLKATPNTDEAGPGIIQKFVEPGLSAPALYKARQFAALYSEQDLERLCGRRLPNGSRLGIGHVYQLIQVADPKRRRALEERTAREGWASRRLRSERMQRTTGRSNSSKAGRKPKPPRSEQEMLQQLMDRTRHWLNWSSTILGEEPEQLKQIAGGSRSPEGRSAALRLDPELRAALLTLQRAFRSLEATISRQKPRTAKAKQRGKRASSDPD